MKHGKYKSTMPLAVGRTGAGKNVVLGVGFCDGESERNCNWFLLCCRAAGRQLNSLPVFADRGKGLIAAVQRLKIQIRFCTRHITGNVRHHFPITTKEEAAIWEIQASESDEEYGAKLDVLAMTHPQVADYLREIDPARWVLFSAIGCHRLYGWRTTNFVESQNAAAVPERKLRTLDVFKSFVEKFMTDAVAIDQSVQAWHRKGMTITPHAEALLQAQQQDIGYLSVRPSSNTAAFVFDTRQVPRYHFRVDLSVIADAPSHGKMVCSCAYSDQHGIPCRHVIATLYDYSKSDSLYDFVDNCYFVDSIAKGYGAESKHAIELILDASITTSMWHKPPQLERRKGRPRVNRFASQGETGATTHTRRRTCTKCNEVGHNRRT
ncbi:TPA: hypothetical protein N0F65_003019 [Lagenidium giganteum]|uniref:SWIM-type domain-containing protein n=1 Tax=Lagenidium giganteum TaxID=4803 RepID=A0AAV2YUQ0_9STRA|nr:TPA: hypothetical protein N0F65_003019 [Lagenidium giganteum]